MPGMPGYRSRHGSNITSLLAQRGDIAAQGALRSGDIWSNAIGGLGQVAAGGFMAYKEDRARKQQQEEIKRRGEALAQLAQSDIWAQDPRAGLAESIKIAGPQDGLVFSKAVMATGDLVNAPDPQVAAKHLPKIATGFMMAGPDGRAQLYPILRNAMIHSQIASEDQLPPEWDEGQLGTVEQLAAAYVPEEDAPEVGSNEWILTASDDEIAQLAARKGDIAAAQRTSPEEAARRVAMETRARVANTPVTPPGPEEEFYLNPEGVVLSSFGVRDKNKVERQANDRGIPVFANASTQKLGVTIESIVADAIELKGLMQDPEVMDSIGPVMGNWTQWKGRLLGLPPKVRRAMQIMTALSDTELRKRSGAQINKAEMKRMMKFTTDPTRPLDHNLSAVDGMIQTGEREYRSLSGSSIPGLEAPPPPPSGGGDTERSSGGVSYEDFIQKYGG